MLRASMVKLLRSLCAGAALFAAHSLALAAPTTHTVAEGHSLGRIAKRYGVSIAALCNANGITRREKIRPGQKLIIPDPSDRDGSEAAEREREQDKAPASRDKDAARDKGSNATEGVLDVGSQRAYYYAPTGAGRLGMKPVIVYLHGRGGNPEQDCRRWATIARRLGWLLCPSGPSAHNGGRAWDNNWVNAHHVTMQSIQALRDKFGRRVQLYGNTLVGFSEGAYAAMNVGVREPKTFNRWLILAASSSYWGGPGLEALESASERVRRVYLITGERDEVVDDTRKAETWLKKHNVTTRVSTPNDMGHELLLERKPFLYEQALRWLNQGDARSDS
jgi:predicted esterase/LysM repeat protein